MTNSIRRCSSKEKARGGEQHPGRPSYRGRFFRILALILASILGPGPARGQEKPLLRTEDGRVAISYTSSHSRLDFLRIRNAYMLLDENRNPVIAQNGRIPHLELNASSIFEKGKSEQVILIDSTGRKLIFPGDGIRFILHEGGVSLIDAQNSILVFDRIDRPLVVANIDDYDFIEDLRAQSTTPRTPLQEELESFIDSGLAGDETSARDVLTNLTEGTQSLSYPISESLNPTRKNLLRELLSLDNLRLQVKVIDVMEDIETSIGFGFDYNGLWYPWPVKEREERYSGLMLSTRAFGLLSTESKKNPADFLSARLGVHYFYSRSPFDSAPPIGKQQGYDSAARAAATSRSIQELEQREEWKFLRRELGARLGDQLYVDVGASAGFETDQEFSARHIVAGLEARAEYRSWSWDSPTILTVPDYPFALLRQLSGYDQEFSPRARFLPSFLGGIDIVVPSGDTLRDSVGDRSSFFRIRGEIHFRTPIGVRGDSRYHFNLNNRSYAELGPGSSVEAGNFNRSGLTSAWISSSSGMFLGYRTGRLPFDDEKRSFFEFGWELTF